MPAKITPEQAAALVVAELVRQIGTNHKLTPVELELEKRRVTKVLLEPAARDVLVAVAQEGHTSIERLVRRLLKP